MREYAKASTERKILALGTDSRAGGNFILDIQNDDVLYLMHIVNGFLVTQNPEAMVGTGCCQFFPLFE